MVLLVIPLIIFIIESLKLVVLVNKLFFCGLPILNIIPGQTTKNQQKISGITNNTIAVVLNAFSVPEIKFFVMQ